uniref:Uncharacterized protein n=1 Tax=Helianthus annuus TaxID=4232 RepID=A0A251TMI0_HELAN
MTRAMLIWRGVKKFGLKSMDLEGLFWYRKMSHFKDAFHIWRKKGCEHKNEFNIDGQEMIFYTEISNQNFDEVEKILIWKASNMPIYYCRVTLLDGTFKEGRSGKQLLSIQ